VLRTVREPIEIAGRTFPVGAVLAPSIYLVQHRRDVWGPDADEFRPERWLGRESPGYTWIPFGGGTRRCIGASFAQLEQEIVLRAIARSVHLEPVGDAERPVARFITSSPARGGEVIMAA
jgi:cytochrome P450